MSGPPEHYKLNMLPFMGHLTSEKKILRAQYELHNPSWQIIKMYDVYYEDKGMRKQALLQIRR